MTIQRLVIGRLGEWGLASGDVGIASVIPGLHRAIGRLGDWTSAARATLRFHQVGIA
jgi:hypothetical protein